MKFFLQVIILQKIRFRHRFVSKYIILLMVAHVLCCRYMFLAHWTQLHFITKRYIYFIRCLILLQRAWEGHLASLFFLKDT